MMAENQPSEQHAEPSAFEREKWEAEQWRFNREMGLRERELSLKEAEGRRSRWWNPLAIAIMGAAVAAAGNAYVSWQNSAAGLRVENFRAEAARIFEVVKTGDPDIAAKNLQFLLDTGLIETSATVDNLTRYLTQRKTGEGLSLPAFVPRPVPSLSMSCMTAQGNCEVLAPSPAGSPCMCQSTYGPAFGYIQ